MGKHLAIERGPRIMRFPAARVSSTESSVSTTRVMEILERIAERRDQWSSNPVPLADRVRVLP